MNLVKRLRRALWLPALAVGLYGVLAVLTTGVVSWARGPEPTYACVSNGTVLMELSSGRQYQREQPVRYQDVRYAPDSSRYVRLTFAEDGTPLEALMVTTEREYTLTGQIRDLQWTPDASQMVFVGRDPLGQFRLTLADRDGTPIASLPVDGSGYCGNVLMGFSADGRYLAVSSGDCISQNTIRLYSLPDLAVQQEFSLTLGDPFGWSPSGSVAYALRSDRFTLYSPDEGELLDSPLAIGRILPNVLWSPDGRYAAVTDFLPNDQNIPGQPNFAVSIFGADGLARQNLAVMKVDGTLSVVPPRVMWVEEGRALLLWRHTEGEQHELVRYWPEEDRFEIIADDLVRPGVFSPDSTQIALYTANEGEGSIDLAALDGSERFTVARVPANPTEAIISMEWSPDGQGFWVRQQRINGSILSWAGTDGGIPPVTYQASAFGQITWLPDGYRFLYTAQHGTRWSIGTVDTLSGTRRLLMRELHHVLPIAAPADRIGFYWQDGEGRTGYDLRQLDGHLSRRYHLSEGAALNAFYPLLLLAPDQHAAVATVGAQGDGLEWFNTGDAEGRPLLTSGLMPGMTAWSPDSQRFGYVAVDPVTMLPMLNVVDAQGAFVQQTPALGHFFWTTCAPDNT